MRTSYQLIIQLMNQRALLQNRYFLESFQNRSFGRDQSEIWISFEFSCGGNCDEAWVAMPHSNILMIRGKEKNTGLFGIQSLSLISGQSVMSFIKYLVVVLLKLSRIATIMLMHKISTAIQQLITSFKIQFDFADSRPIASYNKWGLPKIYITHQQTA